MGVRIRVAVLVVGTGVAATVVSGCTTDGNPVADTSSPVATTTTETTASATTSSATTSSATSSAPTSIPPQNGAATDPMAMTCGTFLDLTDAQQQATVVAIATIRNQVLIKSNENAYRLVRAFCTTLTDLVKDTLMMQGN
ncbi:hypothetical protein [Gordonia sp. CPCC 205333]|uniref:hypothetical protein n=1 Tax=Gordonia sp. CPCC 205333 TaxID=3140790 RepID=UPI003AF3B1AE